MKRVVSCAQCGTKMRAGIKFCSKCGYLLRDAEAEALAEAAQAEEAAANQLTEEEIAAAEAASETAASTPEETAAPAEAVAPAEESAGAVTSEAPASSGKKTEKEQKGLDKKYYKALSKEELKDTRRADRSRNLELSARKKEGELGDLRHGADEAMLSRRSKEDTRKEKLRIAQRKGIQKDTAKTEYKTERALMQAERKKAQVASRAAETDILQKNAENKLLAKKVTADRQSAQRRADADAKIASIRISEDKKASRKSIAEETKITKALTKEEAKAAARTNDELKKTVETRAAENKLYAKKAAAERRRTKKRNSDMERAAKEIAGQESREVKKLGAIELKAAKRGLSAEAIETRSRATEVERQMEAQLYDQKLLARKAAAERKLMKQRARDVQKVTDADISQRAKATKRLASAERRALKTNPSPEMQATRKQADDAKLRSEQGVQEEKLYAKKLSAERRLIKQKAEDARRLQEAHYRDQNNLRQAQYLEDSREVKTKSDETKLALRRQKNLDRLRAQKQSAEERLAEREHNLEVKKQRAEIADREKLADRRAKEQRYERKLAARNEKLGIKRSRKIARISGAPISYIPALTASSTALVPTGEGGDQYAVAEFTTLKKSPDEVMVDYKKAKRQPKGPRFKKIDVMDSKNYHSTFYKTEEDYGEVKVAKRNVVLCRIQGILSVLLIVFALVASFLPMFTTANVALPGELSDLTGIYGGADGSIGFESILTGSTSAGSEDFATYLTTLLGKLLSPDITVTVTNQLTNIMTRLNTALANKSFFTYIGYWVVFLLAFVGILLTPVVILINLILAIVKLIFFVWGKGSKITGIVKNLRAAYMFFGINVFLFLLFGLPFSTGFIFFAAAFAASLLVTFFFNWIKKYNKRDKTYARCVRWESLLRLAVLVFFGSSFAVLAKAPVPADAPLLVSYAYAVCFLLAVICMRGMNKVAFEMAGYSKGVVKSHPILIIFGLVCGAIPFALPMLRLTTGTPDMMPLIAIIAFFAITVLGGLVNRVIAGINKLDEPIINAIEEGYPLK